MKLSESALRTLRSILFLAAGVLFIGGPVSCSVLANGSAANGSAALILGVGGLLLAPILAITALKLTLPGEAEAADAALAEQRAKEQDALRRLWARDRGACRTCGSPHGLSACWGRLGDAADYANQYDIEQMVLLCPAHVGLTHPYVLTRYLSVVDEAKVEWENR